MGVDTGLLFSGSVRNGLRIFRTEFKVPFQDGGAHGGNAPFIWGDVIVMGIGGASVLMTSWGRG